MRRSLLLRIAALLMTLCVAAPAFARTAPQRPRITGISHVGFFTSNLDKTLAFWHEFLGFDEPYALNKPDSNDVQIAFIKINDHQHIELFNTPPTHPPSMLSHICFTVDSVSRMRAYLRSRGIAVPPDSGRKSRAGDYAFEIKDPDGNLLEFVQSLPTGMEAKAAGKFLPSTRIAESIYHVGFLVGDSAKSIAFYHDILGFRETWRGSSNSRELSWITMQVPDGKDYVEFMLYSGQPSNFGTRNHVSLLVPNVEQAIEKLESRPYVKTYGRPIVMQVGKNGKRQVNLYDPDGTRVELMEPHTVTGKPAPSSTAPPPAPAHP